MKKKGVVAIVGRPNVGKSTLFNQFLGKRISIIDNQPGVTRDRIYADCEWQNYKFTLIDTGGIDMVNEDVIVKQMRYQAQLAIDSADVIVFMVDGREGITTGDIEVASILKKVDQPVILVVNKLDTLADEDKMYEFYNLGLGDPFPISSSHKRGFGELLDEIVQHFDTTEEETEEDIIKIAIFGKPNAGKSSLVNKLLGQERVIVSEVAGTTRDTTDTPFTANGKKYMLIDTAGLRRKSRINDDLEHYSVVRAISAVRRCDVGILMIDSTKEVTEQDTKIAGMLKDEGKAIIFVMNKWDLIEKDTHTIESFKQRLYLEMSFLAYAPCIFISALTGQRVNSIIDMVDELYEESNYRISTGVFNEVLNEAIAMNEPPVIKGRKLKINYGTQVATKPPTFILFVNDSGLIHYSFQRYLENYFRKTFMLRVPMKIIFRSKSDKDN